jgi:hypothetical protein
MSATDPKNPYRPGVGLKPLILAGRDAELTRFEAALRAAPEIPANVRLTGLRGVGKSVLLSEMAERARNADWATVTAELEPRHNSEAALLSVLVGSLKSEQERLSRLKRATKAARGALESAGRLELKYQDFSLGLDPTTPPGTGDLAKTLEETVRAVRKHRRHGLVLLLDEGQVLRDETKKRIDFPLSMLLAAVTALQKVEVPLAFVLCGLPTLPTNLIKARSYSERMFRGEEIGSLKPPADREAFEGPLANTGLRATDDLTERLLRDVSGYPYFIQLWGAELWEAAQTAKVRSFTVPLLHAVQPQIYERLDRDFYRPRFDAVTPAEQDVLLASAACPYPPIRVTDLQRASSKSQGNVSVLLTRLCTEGLLYRVRKGEYDYTAPQFHAFLIRHSKRLAKKASGLAQAQTFTTISTPGYATRTGSRN